MTTSLIEIDNFCPDFRADFDRATYFVLEAVHRRSDGTELLLLQEAEEDGLYAISIGLPDRPPLSKTWVFEDFFDAVAALQELRDLRPEVRFFLSVWLDEHGLEILGNDVLRGLIVAQAATGEQAESCEWAWLAEDAAGNGPADGRDYDPFFAAIAARLV